MKLWDKGYDDDARIDKFTVGRDRELDLLLAPYDILGSMAHITMLKSVGLLGADELEPLLGELKSLYDKAQRGEFAIEDDVEDVHSQVELDLTRKLGPTGKRIHTGRSRNDQILLDIKLFCRARIERTVGKAKELFDELQEASEKYREVLIPGYTHLQVAMPSSFGLWFGAYAESLADDMAAMKAAWDVCNLNPLGSAAGYGSSAPLDRTMTTRLLGFADLDWNVVNAQLWRGKAERVMAFAYGCIAETVGRLAMDACLYCSQNFGFLKLPDRLTTGSSIMPHKKNPDVFELVRAHCNRIGTLAGDIRAVTTNLPSGYFRDQQLIKEIFLPMADEMDNVLDICAYAIRGMELRKDVMRDPKYAYAFSVEKVNSLIKGGMPFRDAYRQVGMEIQSGKFEWKGVSASGGTAGDNGAASTGKDGCAPITASDLGHTHEGSLGNLCNDRIAAKMDRALAAFGFETVHAALDALLGEAK